MGTLNYTTDDLAEQRRDELAETLRLAFTNRRYDGRDAWTYGADQLAPVVDRMIADAEGLYLCGDCGRRYPGNQTGSHAECGECHVSHRDAEQRGADRITAAVETALDAGVTNQDGTFVDIELVRAALSDPDAAQRHDDRVRAEVLRVMAASLIAETCEGNYNPNACETCRAVEAIREHERELRARGGGQ